MTLGERVKQRRKQLGLTQEELAHRLGNTSRASVCTVEKDKEDLTTTRVAKLAAALETSPAYLMGWVSNPDPDFPKTKVGIIESARHAAEAEREADIIKEKEAQKAIELYELYSNAPAHIQSAIETLLKSSQQEP